MTNKRYAQLAVAFSVVPCVVFWATLFTHGLGAALLSPWYWGASLPLVLLQVHFFWNLD